MHFSYVIITPAYNEAAYIEQTIRSVLAQSVQPQLWVIVDDGSTDGTAEIVKGFADQHPWIHYVYRNKEKGQTYYASNVYAIQYGIKIIKNLELKIKNYDYLAILDADIALPEDYYEKMAGYLDKYPQLGIVSGIYRVAESDGLKNMLHERRSCPKNIMVFRKECFFEIGGFLPMKYGGEDTCACYMARMKGWKTWSFPEVVAIHLKPVGTGHANSLLKIRFRQGIGEYYLASHPLFILLKSLRRCIKEPPFIIGSLARLTGYMYGFFMKEKRYIPVELASYIRQEQLQRVLHWNTIPDNLMIESE